MRTNRIKNLGQLKGTAALAAGSAGGLSVAHFLVTRRSATGSATFAARVMGPAAAALGPAAAAAHLAAFPERETAMRRFGLLVGAAVMSGLFSTSGVLSAKRRTLAPFTLSGPGLWSLVGTPTFLALTAAQRQPRPRRRAAPSTDDGGSVGD